MFSLGHLSFWLLVTFVSLHEYSEIVIFGLTIIIISTLTAYLMQAKKLAYRLIMFFSLFTIFGIYYFEFLSMELISTKLLLAQLFLNIIAVISIYFVQSLFLGKTVKLK